MIGVVDLCRISNPIVHYSYESFSGLIISGGNKHTYMIFFSIIGMADRRSG